MFYDHPNYYQKIKCVTNYSNHFFLLILIYLLCFQTKSEIPSFLMLHFRHLIYFFLSSTSEPASNFKTKDTYSRYSSRLFLLLDVLTSLK